MTVSSQSDQWLMAAVLHSPYSPDLVACDFLFPKMKLKLKGKRG
jgi:hypothetical protein